MKSRDRRAERMSEFVTNMFQYNVTVGITRSEVICVFFHEDGIFDAFTYAIFWWTPIDIVSRFKNNEICDAPKKSVIFSYWPCSFHCHFFADFFQVKRKLEVGPWAAIASRRKTNYLFYIHAFDKLIVL